jgi:hypothetical protein
VHSQADSKLCYNGVMYTTAWTKMCLDARYLHTLPFALVVWEPNKELPTCVSFEAKHMVRVLDCNTFVDVIRPCTLSTLLSCAHLRLLMCLHVGPFHMAGTRLGRDAANCVGEPPDLEIQELPFFLSALTSR